MRRFYQVPSKKTHEQFIKEVYNLVKDKYTVLGVYTLARKPVEMRHNICGHEYPVAPNDFTSGGRRCPRCSNIGRKVNQPKRKSHDDFLNEVYELVGDEYTVMSEYTGALNHLDIRHNVCEEIYPVSPAKFTSSGRRCPVCKKQEVAVKLGRGIDKMKELLQLVTNGEYELVDGQEYKNIKTKMWFRHTKCNKDFPMTSDNFFNSGSRCTHCKESKGERLVSSILRSLKIKYKKEYKFEDCIYKQPSKFDFAIPLKDKIILIEYDGIQHFKPVEMFGGEKGFKETQARDKVKNDYCDSRDDLHLIRIPYTFSDEEVKSIIISNLSKHGLLQ